MTGDSKTPEPASEGTIREPSTSDVEYEGSVDAFQEAVDELSMAGFGRRDLSLMASDETVKERLGQVYQRAEDAKDDPAAPRVSYASPEDTGDAQGMAIGGVGYIGAVAAGGGATVGLLFGHRASLDRGRRRRAGQPQTGAWQKPFPPPPRLGRAHHCRFHLAWPRLDGAAIPSGGGCPAAASRPRPRPIPAANRDLDRLGLFGVFCSYRNNGTAR